MKKIATIPLMLLISITMLSQSMDRKMTDKEIQENIDATKTFNGECWDCLDGLSWATFYSVKELTNHIKDGSKPATNTIEISYDSTYRHLTWYVPYYMIYRYTSKELKTINYQLIDSTSNDIVTHYSYINKKLRLRLSIDIANSIIESSLEWYSNDKDYVEHKVHELKSYSELDHE